MQFARTRPVASFFALALSLSWVVWIPGFLLTDGATAQTLMVVGSFGPAVAAALLTKARGRSLRGWARDMARVRVGARWWLVAVALPVAVAAVSAVVYAVQFGELDPGLLPERIPRWLFGLVFVTLLGGGNEEPGWRGYAVPHLQREYSALTASLVVGAVWALWHLPLYVVPGGYYEGRPFLLFVPLVLAVSVVLTWLYNSTDGSVVAAMVFHAGFNSASVLIPVPLAGLEVTAVRRWHVGVRLASFGLLALALVGYYGSETLSRSSKRTTAVDRDDPTDDHRTGVADAADA